MPNRPYTIDPNSSKLTWKWEKIMTNTLANNKSIKRRCIFCNRDITNATYTFKKGGKTFHACSGCKFLYQTIYEEVAADRLLPLRRMLNMAMLGMKHCKCCKWFDERYKRKCKKEKYTGLGDDSGSYPLTYANHGCPYFQKINYLYNIRS